MHYTAKLVFLTPCFSHGSTDAPEVRPSSIRGMLHHWFRILGGSATQERLVFGGINFGKQSPFQDDSAGKVVVRVRHDANADIGSFPTLPHKPDIDSSRTAFKPGHAFELLVFDRLGGLHEADEALFRDSLEAWLLMGTLGFRATRAAGSFHFESSDFSEPSTPSAYQFACRDLLARRKAKMRVAILPQDYADAEAARCLVSDSLGGRDHPQDSGNLGGLHDPLGKIFDGRKTSPLKYRIVRFGDAFRILALWDDRTVVTGNQPSDLSGVIRLFQDRKPDLGRQLATAFGL